MASFQERRDGILNAMLQNPSVVPFELDSMRVSGLIEKAGEITLAVAAHDRGLFKQWLSWLDSIDLSSVPNSANLFESATQAVQRSVIVAALDKVEGNQVRAASLLGLHRNSLRRYMELLGLSAKRPRSPAATK